MANIDRTVPPAIREIDRIAIQQPRRYTTPEGIAVNVLDRSDEEITMVKLMVEGGIVENENKHLPQLMSFSLREGTGRRSGREIADIVDHAGAWYKTATSAHHKTATLIVPTKRLHSVIGIMAETITTPSFPAEAVASILSKMQTAWRIDNKKPSTMAKRRLEQMIYSENHPLLQTDDFAELTSLAPDALQAEWRRQIERPRMSLYLAGRVDAAAERLVISTLLDAFSQSDITPSAESRLNVVPFPESSPQGHTHIDCPESLQTSISMAINVPIDREHPDYIPLRLAILALGGYFGSRLMRSVREEMGLTYGINAALSGMREGTQVMISTECDSKYATRAIEAIEAEISSMSSRTPAGEELSRARRQWMVDLADRTSNPLTLCEQYFSHQLIGAPSDWAQRSADALPHITTSDIKRVSEKWLRPEALTIVTAGQSSARIK